MNRAHSMPASSLAGTVTDRPVASACIVAGPGGSAARACVSSNLASTLWAKARDIALAGFVGDKLKQQKY